VGGAWERRGGERGGNQEEGVEKREWRNSSLPLEGSFIVVVLGVSPQSNCGMQEEKTSYDGGEIEHKKQNIVLQRI
jgi:hypothetical protein